MKKILFLLSAAAMLLAGCAKEALTGSGEGEQTVSISVAIPDVLTKAAADNDGNAKKANRWIFEVRDAQGALFFRKVEYPVAGTTQQTFKVSLIKNQSYNLLFWADNNGGFYNAEDLTNVTLTDASAYVGNLDARDAFTACKTYTATNNESVSVELYRPFAQLNVVTTDLETLWAQAQTTSSPAATYLKFEPKNYIAKLAVPTSFNVKTQQCGEASDIVVTASESYFGYQSDKVTPQANNNYQLHTNPATLFMDYVFASKGQKDIVDISFEFTSNDGKISYAFTSIPMQANYRTNINGKILSYDTEWNVTIEPAWLLPEESVDVFETTINNIAALNEVLASTDAGNAKEVTATATMPTDSNEETVEFTSNNNNQVINLNFEGTLGTDKTITFANAASAEGPSCLNIIAPSGTKLVFDNPMTHVVINGTSYDNISGTFSANSLIIPAGVVVKNLVIDAGGLEIHGTVNAVTVNGTKENVFVRDCENLSNDVYNAIKGYIAEGYEAVPNGDNWDIVPENNWINFAADSFLKVEGNTITINSAEQLALLAKNVLGGNTYAGYTFILGANIDLAGREWTPIGVYSYRENCVDKNTTVSPKKAFCGVFDGNGHTVSNMNISVPDNGKSYNGAGLFGYMTAGSIKNLTVANPSIEARLYVGAVVGYPYTGTSIENCFVNGDIKITASWYCGGVAGNGYINSIKECSVIGNAGSFIKGNAVKFDDGTAGYFGGIIGFSGENCQVVEKCSVENVDITADCNGVGGIAGILHYGNTVKNCSLKNVNILLNSNNEGEIARLGLYAGGNNGTDENIGWCINNSAENCTVASLAGPCSVLVGTQGSGASNPVYVAGYGVELNEEGKVFAGTFQAIPQSVVADGYKIVPDGDLYKVIESDNWMDHAAKEYASKDISGKTITIANEAQLALFRNDLAKNNTCYSGYTVTISADLDMKKYFWEPIPGISNVILDGANHTISNLTVKADNGYGNAFISYDYGCTIKNIVFDKASVSRNGVDYSGNIYAVVAAYAGYYTDATFENVTVKDSYVSGYGKVGAIAGMAEMQGNTLKFKDCKVENTTIKGVYNVGGLIGNFQYQVSDCRNTIIIENSSSVDYTFIPAEMPDRNFSERTTIEGLTGSYLVSGEWYYAENAKYYCEYNTPVADEYNADALIHNTPDSIIPE